MFFFDFTWTDESATSNSSSSSPPSSSASPPPASYASLMSQNLKLPDQQQQQQTQQLTRKKSGLSAFIASPSPAAYPTAVAEEMKDRMDELMQNAGKALETEEKRLSRKRQAEERERQLREREERRKKNQPKIISPEEIMKLESEVLFLFSLSSALPVFFLLIYLISLFCFSFLFCISICHRHSRHQACFISLFLCCTECCREIRCCG